ncbi:MAG TPA: insulinase family protein [Candidatus Baltobacteraceae bacterium]|jgi:predicted Zn-dependent peptidase|nr:insulinase family protein [Candidatus Baltobacteraceae bacterium]
MKRLHTGLLFLGLTAAATNGASATSSGYPATQVQQIQGIPLSIEVDPNAELTAVDVFIPAGLERETVATSGISALLLRCLFQTPVTGVSGTSSLKDAVESFGASIDADVTGQWSRISLVARSDQMPLLVDDLYHALANPDFSAKNLAMARKGLLSRLGETASEPVTVGVEMFRRAYYVGGNGLPALGSVPSIMRLRTADLSGFFAQTYVQGGAHVSLVGLQTPALRDSVKRLVGSLRPGSLPAVTIQTRPFEEKPMRVVARRKIGNPLIVVGFPAPSPENRDFATMLVINAVLTEGIATERTTESDVPESIGSSYLYDIAPASLAVYINGGRLDPNFGVNQLINVASSLGDRELNAEALTKFKAVARGSLLMSTLNAGERASLLGLFAQGGANDPLNGVLSSLDAVSGADVQRVAKQYLKNYTVALVLPQNETDGK